MKLFGTFSGSGIFELAAQNVGIEVIGVCEIDKNCIKLLQDKFPDAYLETDIRNVTRKTFRSIGKPDIITGGFPCQDLSVAGRRAGLAGGRSGLYFEFQRIVCETLPHYVLVENVPGLLSSNDGRDFAIVLGGFAGFIPEVPRNGWKNSGFVKGKRYHIAWAVLDSQYFGVPQRRERVFIVASLGEGSCAQILFEPESLSGNPPPSRETGSRLTADIAASIRGGGGSTGRGYNLDAEQRLAVVGTLTLGHTKSNGLGAYENDIASTLEATGSAGQAIAFGHSGGETLKLNEVANAVNTQTGSETTAMLQGVVEVPPTHKRWREGKEGGGKGELLSEELSLTMGTSNDQVLFDMQAIGQYGDGNVASSLKQRDYKDATDLVVGGVAPTLGTKSASANMHNGYEETGFIVPSIFTFNQNEDCLETEVSPAINANANKTGRNVGKIVAPFDGSQITSKGNRATVEPGSVNSTLNSGGQASVIEIGSSQTAREMHHANEVIRESPDNNISPTLQARMGTGGNDVPCIGVRRLTPLECERLQGMPDNHTSGFADSVRYKMCGNAVTYNVVYWILKRMNERR